MITKKPYYCPTCGNKEMHETNHHNEIYCNCKACGNSPLYCGVLGISPHQGLRFTEASLHYYYYNLEKVADATAYTALVEKLTRMNYTVWTQHSVMGKEFKVMERHNNTVVRLYLPDAFDNQYISNIGRLFPWKEAIHPNCMIKEGYYLLLPT